VNRRVGVEPRRSRAAWVVLALLAAVVAIAIVVFAVTFDWI
jgi:hypothetical protein